MKNFEKYKDEILELASEGSCFGFADDEVVRCGGKNCRKCKFYGDCVNARFKWLYEENIKPKPRNGEPK